MRSPSRLLTLTVLLASSLTGCRAGDEPFPSASLGHVSSEVKFGNCQSASGKKCSDLAYTDVPASGLFYLTDFVGEQMGCAGMKWADGTWAYVADSQRFGCGSKVKVEANGKSCVAVVADCGPNKGVEDAAYDSKLCSGHYPVLDASPLISKHLFGTSSAGWSDHLKVTVTLVDKATPEGCGNGPPPASGKSGSCTTDASCQNGTPGEGTLCKAGACVDGCRKNADCPTGGTCSVNDGTSAGKCSNAPTTLGTACKLDSDCGKPGEGRVCSASQHVCIIGCHTTTDCGSGAICDKSGPKWRCVTRKTLGQACTSDPECNGGMTGTQRICSDATKLCDDLCRTNADCLSNEACGANKKCAAKPSDAVMGSGVSSSCVITYPSGVAIQGVSTPGAVKASYTSRGCGAAPACMINVSSLKDANTGESLSYNHVKLSEHFTLREMTHQSVASSPYVFVDPAMVAHLEQTRVVVAKPMGVNSGYRSPVHQNEVCMGMCGKSYCPGGCALCSDHMGGQAVDLKHSAPKCDQAKPSCDTGKFHLIYNEPYGGDHLHVDIGPKNPVCHYKAISCK